VSDDPGEMTVPSTGDEPEVPEEPEAE